MKTKARILLVQNAQTQGNGTKRHLASAGYDVVWAGSGVSALMAVRQQPVDLILIDVALPDIEGGDLCKRFRARESTRSVPIILLTTKGHLPESANGRSDGPDDHLAKPYTESELDARIERALIVRAGNVSGRPEPHPHPAVMPGTAAPREPEGRTLTSVPSNPPARTQPALAPVIRLEPRMDARTLSAPRAATFPVRQQEPLLRSVASAATKPAMQPQNVPGPETYPDTSVRTEMQLPAVSGTQPQPAAPAAATPFSVMGEEVIDPTTGLFGRRQFEAMFSKEFKRSVRFKQQMSCMLIDLDGRKMGRSGDDATLRGIIRLVQQTIREVDTAAWWSGEALIILLPNTIKNDAVQAAMRILESVANHPFTWSDSTKVTMNIGVAGMPDRNIDTEQKLIDAAARACKRASDFISQ